jgi:hypothetical protein
MGTTPWDELMDDEPREFTVDSDNYTIDVPDSGTAWARRPRLDWVRLLRICAVTWTVAMLVAVVTGAVLNFVEAAQACAHGLGAVGSGRAEVTFRSAISVTCHTRDGSFDIPMNGAAAVVLFGGLGLVGIIVLGTAYRFANRRQSGAATS